MKKQQFISVMSVMIVGLATMAAGCSSKPAVTPATVTPVVTPSSAVTPNSEVIEVPLSSTTTPLAQPAKPVGAQGLRPVSRPPAVPLVVSPKLKIIRVNIANMAFSPQVIAVSAGDTVQWVNTDTVAHTVTSDGSLLWDSGTIKPGASYERQFKFAGSYPYHCGIHSTMKGTVVIH